jgi:hypothetical protein
MEMSKGCGGAAVCILDCHCVEVGSCFLLHQYCGEVISGMCWSTAGCNNDGIVLPSFPLRTSHKLQPLDISVVGLLNSSFQLLLNDKFVMSVGRTLKQLCLPNLTAEAYLE